MAGPRDYAFNHINSSESNTLVTGGGNLISLSINEPSGASGATLELFDGTDSSGTTMAKFNTSSGESPQSFNWDGMRFNDGLYYESLTNTAGDLSVTMIYDNEGGTAD